MIKPVHFSKTELREGKGQVILPLADAKELSNTQKLHLNEQIATIISQKGSENA